MKLHRGTLHTYYATGEGFHWYVWTGDPKAEFHENWDNHIPVEFGEVIELVSPKGEKTVIHYFPCDFSIEKTKQHFIKLYGEENWNLFIKASHENWQTELVKF